MTCRVRRLSGCFVLLATVFLLASLAGSDAAAQQGGRGSQDLYTLVEQAQAHVVAGRWQSAIDTYLEAWKLSRDPGYLYNISVLYLVRLKDEAKALEYAERYAEQARNDSEKAEAEGLIKRIRRSISDTHGKLIVEVLPRGLDVALFIDGQPVDNDTWVESGKHVLGAQAAGYVPYTQQVTIEPGSEFKISIRLKTIEG
ncbi:MAG TPA: PEGA domain-containing protein, partial [Myxococcota bacterium]|nr:PEGA domain-containing protein [Myxococcota bacterium]